MKTITISTENSETYSSISNFFIDYYMTDANGEFVKVYLYLVRLLSNNTSITVAEIADHFNLTENDICRAIKYWIGQNVLKLNYDGKGNLSGIVLLPLYPAQNEPKLSSDAVSILRTTAVNAEIGNTPIERAQPEISNTVGIITPVKHKLSKAAIDAKQSDDDWSDIVYQVETLFGKQISASDTESLMYIYDDLKFNVELFEYLIEYCTTMNKKNCRYMEAVAIAWYKDGIKTRQQAKEQSVITHGITKIVFKALGIRRAYPTNIEVAYINTWSKDFGFSSQLIEHACNRAIEARPSSANFAYINGILENWHKNGVKTIDDINKLDAEFITRNSRKKAGTSAAVNFNNFKQTRLDNELTEMEDLFLKEVNQ
ncbi:MAG: DnaD domain protein [Lachnospiraceae bacterium]|nr:DnaD domain protein [Lachnospiraceae bacterium]